MWLAKGGRTRLMPIKLCSVSSSHGPAVYKGRCRQCARTNNRQTRSENKSPVYNRRKWQILRSRYLFANPLCECGCRGIAEDVHHKRAIGDGGDPWAWDNLEALTHACHSQATRREQTGATR